MIKVLITSAGTGGGFATSKALYDNFRDKAEIHQTDINPKHLISSSKFADYFYQSPRVDNTDYPRFISNIVNANQIDVIIPFIDQDVFEFAKLYESVLISQNIKLQVKSEELSRICFSKYLAFKWMQKEKINTPYTFMLDDSNSLDKFIIKPLTGYGSKIIFGTKDDLKTIKNKDNYIGQEICAYPEVTVDVFYQKSNNNLYYICRERIETKEGVCTKARLFADPELGNLAQKLAKGLQLSYFCFQIMKLKNKWAITDINPRLGAGSSMGQVVGMDFYGAMVCDLLELDYSTFITQYNSEAYVTRQYLNILSNEKG